MVWNRSLKGFMELKPRNRDDHQEEGVFHRLEKIRVVEHIGIVVGSHAEIRLGSKVIALLQGIDENVYERIYHKAAEKQDGRKQVQPGL